MPDAHDDGRLLGGRYRLRSELGSGGMGTVWSAYDELLDREVAIKELSVPSSSPERHEVLIRRTMREARIAGRLHHPNIAAVYDVVAADGRPWIVMQLIRSRSLAGEIYDRGALAVPTVARIGLDVLAALRAAHAAGVLHRDVKPANILLTADGHAVLTDFGLATTLDDDAGLTQHGMVMGTPAYLAPERAAGRPATALSDVWSLGATLYTAVEGRAPFAQGGSRADTLNAVLTGEPAPFEQAGELAPVLSAMLTKDPAERADAARVQELLLQVAGRSARFMTLPVAAPRSPRVRRLVAARWRETAAVAALVITVLATVSLNSVPGVRPRAEPIPQPTAGPPTGVLRAKPSSSPRATDDGRRARTERTADKADEETPDRTGETTDADADKTARTSTPADTTTRTGTPTDADTTARTGTPADGDTTARSAVRPTSPPGQSVSDAAKNRDNPGRGRSQSRGNGNGRK